LKGPDARRIQNYACYCLGLKSYFQQPGDGRKHPHIPAREVVWALVYTHILRVVSFFRLEWLLRSAARANLDVHTPFGEDVLAYCTERLDPETTRVALATALHQAKRNKAFENSRFIGLALDGTGAGRTYKPPCPFCEPIKDPQGVIHGSLHHFVLISVVGAGGLTLPVDVEPYGPGDSEYAAAQRLLRRAVAHLGPRFADYLVGDGAYATAPFLHETEAVGIPVVARLKENLPLLAAAVRARFDGQPRHAMFQEGDDQVEVWDADFDPWETLDWPTVRVLRYRQRHRNGTVIQAEWLTNFPIGKLSSLSFYRMAKSRWEIENRGFNDGKNRYGLERLCHHEPNSILIVWLLTLLALVIERLYRLRYLHRGEHGIRSPMDLVTHLWLTLGARTPNTS
jgi:hypothetical protein